MILHFLSFVAARCVFVPLLGTMSVCVGLAQIPLTPEQLTQLQAVREWELDETIEWVVNDLDAGDLSAESTVFKQRLQLTAIDSSTTPGVPLWLLETRLPSSLTLDVSSYRMYHDPERVERYE